MIQVKKAYPCPVCGSIMTPPRPPRKGDYRIPYYCENDDCAVEKLKLWISKTDLNYSPDGCYQGGWNSDC